MRSETDLRIGVIGVGGRGRLAAQAHRPGQGSRLVAGADVSADALTQFAEAYPDARTFTDYRAMLAEVALDAVFIASPDYLHEEHAVAALSRGIAVYLEKPMAITIEGCDRILAAAAATQAKLYVGHNMRHMPFVREMKRLIDSGAIGAVKAAWCRHFIAYGGDAYFKDWHSQRRYVNSLLLQKAVHDIDVLHWLCGGQTERVVGMGGLTLYDQVPARRGEDDRGNTKWSDDHWPPMTQQGLSPQIDVEDLNHLLLRLDNGVLVTYQQCHYTPDAWRNYTIIGTAGRIENAGTEPGACEIRIWNQRTHYNEQADERIAIPPLEGSHGGADPLIVAEFLRYVRDDVPTAISPEAARAAVAAAAMGAESVRADSAPRQVPAYAGVAPGL
ncbi:MAG: Gfo/Idh/MocA family oxidoreductase [Phycisphaeraceae bacterium]